MKFIKASNGKQRISLSKAEWLDLGKKAGWVKTAQDFNDFGPIEDLDIEEEQQPEDQLHDDDLKYEIETETKAWFDVVVESEDLMVEGRPDIQGLANRIYEIVQGSLAAGMQDKGSLKRDIYSAASDWLADEDRKGTVSIFEEIPSFHFKSIAQRICTRAMDRDNLV